MWRWSLETKAWHEWLDAYIKNFTLKSSSAKFGKSAVSSGRFHHFYQLRSRIWLICNRDHRRQQAALIQLT